MTFLIITIAITELFNIFFYLEYRFSDLYCQFIWKANEWQIPWKCYPCHRRWYTGKSTQNNT